MSLPDNRRAGVCLHLTSLPGAFGIGELGAAARRFVDRLEAMGIGVWQFLPTGPTAFGDSPYQPLSTFAGNPSLIDIGELIELGLLRAADAETLTGLPEDRVDYGELIVRKSALLERLPERFEHSADASLRAEYDAFLDRHYDRWLRDYALFRYLKRCHGERPWPEWAAEYRRREPRAIERAAHDGAASIRVTLLNQFLFYRQWDALRRYANAAGVTLFGDMPIYIALDSADAWASREILRLDDDGRPSHVAGVPPDYFSADGQLWGNPLYDWAHHAATGYAWWVERLRHTVTMMDMVRIDHFRGFESYWAIPSGATTAKQGNWEPGPGDAIFDAIRQALGELPIVAEDLGEITPEVDALRERQRIPGMKVLQFLAAEDDFELASIGEHCVCYTGTHDNDTTVGWFNGGPGDRRTAGEILAMQRAVLKHTGGQPATIGCDLVRLAFASAARLAMAPLQDYLGYGSETRMNTPGSSYGNWRWRMNEADIGPGVVETVRGMVENSGRTD